MISSSQSIIILLLPFSSFACLAMSTGSSSNSISARSVWEQREKEGKAALGKIPDKEDYPLYEDLLPPPTSQPLKIEKAIEEIYPGVFPLAVQLPHPTETEVPTATESTIDPDQIYRLTLENVKKEQTTASPSTIAPYPPRQLKMEEFHIGEGGRPITRVLYNSQCQCTPSVYNDEWCPYGVTREECERDYLTLPNDSESVFLLSTDNCSLHFECATDYSLYGNVFLPLGVFPQPSNLERELTTAQRNGFTTAFECSQQGYFELVFVSSRRRVVFVIHDLACVRRFDVNKVSKKTRNGKRKIKSHQKHR